MLETTRNYKNILLMSAKEIAPRVQWLRGRALDSRLGEPGFVSCAAELNPWATFFTLHCSSSLSYINEYLAIDRGGYIIIYMSSLHAVIVAYDRMLPREAEMLSWHGSQLKVDISELEMYTLNYLHSPHVA